MSGPAGRPVRGRVLLLLLLIKLCCCSLLLLLLLVCSRDSNLLLLLSKTQTATIRREATLRARMQLSAEGVGGEADTLVLGHGDELKLKAKMRARFWEEDNEQLHERVALNSVEGFDRRKEAKEKYEQGRQTLEKREEERRSRQKQKAENNKERVREIIKKDKARSDLQKLKDFLKDHEHVLIKRDEERIKAMKLAGARFRA